MLKKIILLTFLILLSINLFAQSDILSVETKSSTNAILKNGEFQVAVLIQIKHPWHINSWKPADEFSIPTKLTIDKSANYIISEINYPDHKLIQLSTSDEPAALYEGDITIFVKGKLTDSASSKILLTGTLNSQGCNNTSCLPPTDNQISIEIPVVKNATEVKEINNEFFNDINRNDQTETIEKSEGFNVSESFAKKGIFLTFILIFLGGLALNLTPCIYPLIPITMSYFGGQTSNSKEKTIFLALFYVLGMALVNSSIGTVAALSGGLLGSFMTNPIVLFFIAGVLLALALSMFGVYEFGLPSFLTNMGGGAKSGYFGALMMGMTMGVVAAPCIGPFVIGLLTYVASTGNPFIGFSMFFTLSLGMGLPFVFLAFFSSKITNLPKAGDWMVGVRIIFGIILVGMALYFLNPIIPDTIFAILLPLFLIISGVYLLVFNKSGDSTKAFSYFKKILAILAVFAAGYFAKMDNNENVVKMDWQKFSPEYFESAISNDRPVMIDFYADWCIPCKELDKLTFTDNDIIELSKKFDLVKVDLTSGVEGEIQKLRDKYEVKGVPTIIFINAKGKEIKSLRTLGFVKSEKFIKKMQTTIKEN